MRHLQAFPKADNKKRPLNDAERRQLLFKKLVESEYWTALKAHGDELMGAYAQPMPLNAMQLIGYTTYSIVRDVLSQFFITIEELAKSAPEIQELE